MAPKTPIEVDRARQAAIEVLLHNLDGPYEHLPRTAGWGYPEPYTRDLLICGLGVMVSGQDLLMDSLRRVLEKLAENQSVHGHIPSLVHDPSERGASDTTPLFLIVLAMYRKVSGQSDFLAGPAEKALTWMDYQSPSDHALIGQLPTTDWRDEQVVMGFGLYVNALAYAAYRLFGMNKRAKAMLDTMHHFTITADAKHRHVHEGLTVVDKPYYAMYSYKHFSSERFDLLGNSLAILTGIAPRSRAQAMLRWIEKECDAMRACGVLAVGLSPNFFPFVQPSDPEWSHRYELHNAPGIYHNGGIWPFVSAFHVAAMVAAGRTALARRKLAALTELVTRAKDQELAYGFNEYARAQDGRPLGQDWQSWSAAMYLYAAACVEQGRTPFFDTVRKA